MLFIFAEMPYGPHGAIGRIMRHFCLLVGYAVFVRAAAQDPPHRAYTVADGLSSNTVYCAAQDHEGYMWFGTDAGACRFDGQRFDHFTASDGLPDNEVLGIYVDGPGRVWFLGLNGRAGFYSRGTFSQAANTSSLAAIQGHHGLLSIADDGKGGVWIGGFDSELLHWSEGKVTQTEILVPNAPPTRGMVKLLRLTDGSLFAMCNMALFDIGDGPPRFRRMWGSGEQGYPLAVPSGDHFIAVGRSRLLEVRPDADRLIALLDSGATVHGGRMPFVGRDGDIWCGWENGGVVRVRERDGQRPLVDRWFERCNVNTIAQDNEGNIWWCTDGNGVYMSDPAQLDMRQYITSDDVRERAIHSVCISSLYGVLIGSSHGKIFRIDQDRILQFASPGALGTGRDRVRMLDEASDGEVWIALDTWFGKYAQDRLQTIPKRSFLTDPPIIQHSGVKAFAIGPGDRVVASFFGLGEVVPGPTGSEARFDRSLWKGTQRIYAPFIDSANTLWFESGKRLHRCADGQVTDFPALDAEFGLRITSIAGVDARTLAIGSAGGGVKLIRDGQVVRRFTTAEGLPSDEVRKLRMRHGALLVATDHGAAVIGDPLAQVGILAWTVARGLPSNDVQDVDSDGNVLWMATAAGLCSAPQRSTEHVLRPPTLRFTRLMVGDRSPPLEQPLRFELGTRLQVTAHGFCFRMPEAVEYTFRDERDTSWTPSSSGTITLSDPGPGHHALLVRARLPDSPWSEPIALRYEVLRPWHMTWWFRSALVVALILMGMLLVRYLTRRRLRAHLLRLERENAQQEERRRIAADMHDDLGADISHLLLLTRESAGSATLSEQDRANIAAMERHADRMVRKIDEVIWSLDPQDDRLLPTLQFIQRQCEEFAESHRLGFRTAPITDGDRPYPSTLRRELFLLVRELLTNIAKHTDARRLRFEARIDEEHFSITLEDDGKTLEPLHRPRNGHGRANIRQRLEKLAGEARTEPLSPQGTRTIIEVWTGHIHQ